MDCNTVARWVVCQIDYTSEDIDVDEIVPPKSNLQQDEHKCRDSEWFSPSAFNDFNLQEQFTLAENIAHESRNLSTFELVAEVEEQVWDGKSVYWLRPRRTTSNVQQAKPWNPTTVPRKYVFVSPTRRNEVSYKRLRQRNNVAVRKWRLKMKEKQEMKEDQLNIALIEQSIVKEELRIVREILSRCRCQQEVSSTV